MERKLADGSIESEYKKLRTQSRGETPRKPASEPMRERDGLGRPELESWTDEELWRAANVLDVEPAENMDREALIDALLDADATLARSRRPSLRAPQ
jgi:hypothetical protein